MSVSENVFKLWQIVMALCKFNLSLQTFFYAMNEFFLPNRFCLTTKNKVVFAVNLTQTTANEILQATGRAWRCWGNRIPSAWNRSPIEKLMLKITTKSQIEFRQAGTKAKWKYKC